MGVHYICYYRLLNAFGISMKLVMVIKTCLVRTVVKSSQVNICLMGFLLKKV
jgi:hypothetical protein